MNKLFGKKDVKIVAHRGLSGIELENTISSFVAAGNTGCYGIETDVHRTLDGKFVVIHDDVTSRVSDVTADVENSFYSDLKAVNLGHIADKTVRTDRRIPDLSEYIDVCKTYRKKAILELKNHFALQDIKRITKIIDEAGYLSETVFISFDSENLKAIRDILPEQPVQFLCTKIEKGLAERLKTENMDVDVKYTALNKEIIGEFHRNGIKVNCWTVNDREKVKELSGYGVDYITTDFAGTF